MVISGCLCVCTHMCAHTCTSELSHVRFLARLLCPWDSPGKNTGMGCHALLQGIFPTQRSNPGLPHGKRILYHLSHQVCLRILEWVVHPFSRGSPWPRNWTGVSCIAGRFFTTWATRGVLIGSYLNANDSMLDLLSYPKYKWEKVKEQIRP